MFIYTISRIGYILEAQIEHVKEMYQVLMLMCAGVHPDIQQ